MIGRYSVLSGIVVVVALVTGLVVHLVSGTTTYRATCQFQLALPATAASTNVASSDVLAYNRRLAKDEISRVPTRPIFESAAKKTGLPAGKIAASQFVVPASDSTIAVVVSYSDAATTVKLANVLCANYVAQMRKQLTADYASEGKQMRRQLRSLVAQQTQLRRAATRHQTTLELHQRDYLNQAIARAKQFLAVIYSSPHFSVSLLQPAFNASSTSTKPSLSKSLIVAVAAGLLLSFLLILLLETIRGRRQDELSPAAYGATYGPPPGAGGAVPPPPAPAPPSTQHREEAVPPVRRASPPSPAPEEVGDAPRVEREPVARNGGRAQAPSTRAPAGERSDPNARQPSSNVMLEARAPERVATAEPPVAEARVARREQPVAPDSVATTVRPQALAPATAERNGLADAPASVRPEPDSPLPRAGTAAQPRRDPAAAGAGAAQRTGHGIVIVAICLLIVSAPLFATRRTRCVGHGTLPRQQWSLVVPFSSPAAARGCSAESGATVALKALGID